MRREWRQVDRQERERDPGLPIASSLTGRRLLAAATVVCLGVLTIGVAVASMLPPPTEAAEAVEPVDPGPQVAGAVEEAPATDIDDAVTVERNGPLVPAPVEHLTVAQVSVSTCGIRSVGSGVIVAPNLLLTAAHVVGDAALVRVDASGVTVTGEVLGVLGDGRDVALVRVDAPMDAPLPAADRPEPGAPVTLVGHIDGGPRAVLVGAATEVAPVVATLAGGGDILGVDVSIRAGISGGIAVDADGEVIGIVVAKEEATDTALVVALPELATIHNAGLVPGECQASA